MRRACAVCLAPVLEDPGRDTVACSAHGRLWAWLVTDGRGAIVAAGRRMTQERPAASWLAPSPGFLTNLSAA